MEINKNFITKLCFRESMPAFCCYFPLGMVYGLLFVKAGFSWFYAPLFSFFVCAGAMQFLALSLSMLEVSLITLALSLIPLGIRNIFYGITMLKRYQKFPLWLRSYLAFGLVDATYSILVSKSDLNEKDDHPFIIRVTILIHICWVLGTILGALLAEHIFFPKGLEFFLTAFFAASSFEQLMKNHGIFALLITGISTLFALLIAPNYFFLAAASIAFILCLIVPKKKEAYDQ